MKTKGSNSIELVGGGCLTDHKKKKKTTTTPMMMMMMMIMLMMMITTKKKMMMMKIELHNTHGCSKPGICMFAEEVTLLLIRHPPIQTWQR